tara:strand:+ start:1095 stop:1526 length:432 start_codon:yes stop_codon:yes gene_type:complete
MNTKTKSDHLTFLQSNQVDIELNSPEGNIVDHIYDIKVYWDSEIQLLEDKIHIMPHVSQISLVYNIDNHSYPEEEKWKFIDEDHHLLLDQLAGTYCGWKIEFRYRFGNSLESGLTMPTRLEIHYLYPSKSRDEKTIRALITFN